MRGLSLLGLCLLCPASVEGFILRQTPSPARRPSSSTSSTSSTSSSAGPLLLRRALTRRRLTEEEALLEQVKKLREEAAALEDALPEERKKEMAGPTPEEAAAAAALNPMAPPALVTESTTSEIGRRLASLPYDAESCRSTLDGCKEERVITLWDSKLLKFKATGLGELDRLGLSAAALGVNSDDSLEELKNALGVVVIASGICAVGSLALIGGNLGASLTYLFAVFPILFLGVGSSSPGIISGVLEVIKTRTDPQYEERRLYHEAAHFLVGYLLGIPIAGYNTDAVAPEVVLYDTKRGDKFDESDVEASSSTFFSAPASGGGGGGGGGGAGRGIELDESEVDCLSVVALSGAVAECIYFETAKGCQGDLAGLNFLMSRCGAM